MLSLNMRVASVATAITFGAITSAAYAQVDVVSSAKALIEHAKSGLVAAKDPKKPELQLGIADFAPVTDWAGPQTSVRAPERKKVVAIACATVAPFCANVAQGVVEAGKALGWGSSYIDGKGSVQGFVQAFETAINQKPDAIITMAIPESIVASYIAKAHAVGIKVIGASAIPEKVSIPDGQYDAYVSMREDSNALFQAWFAIADSDGKASVTWMWDPGYPFLVAELQREKAIIADDCPGCKVGEVGLRELEAAANPVRMQQLGTGLLSRNAGADYVLTAYGLNAHSIAIAAQSAGRKVKVVSKNNDPNNVAFVSQGQLYAEMGAPANWGGWATMDQTVRVLAGAPPLAATEENQPEHVFVKDNAPSNGELDWTKLYDYKMKYLQLWGRK